MKKNLILFGTRPEAIKMALLVKEFQKYSEVFETKVCVTSPIGTTEKMEELIFLNRPELKIRYI